MQPELCRLPDMAKGAEMSAQGGQRPVVRAVHYGLHYMQYNCVGHRTPRNVAKRAQRFGRWK